jgi:hypothetical protein
VLREFCGCSPAYTPPDVPSGLNADPGAEIERPGWLPRSSQLWFGCPVFEGPRCKVVVLVGAAAVGLFCVEVMVELLGCDGCIAGDARVPASDRAEPPAGAASAPIASPAQSAVATALRIVRFMVPPIDGLPLPY